MSMLSRERKRSRAAVAAATFVLSLFTYLVVTAIPAFAATTCVYTPGPGADDDNITVTIDTDDDVWMLIEGASFGGPSDDDVFLVVNGNTIVACPNAANDIDNIGSVTVNGNDAGNESFTIVNHQDPATALGDDGFGDQDVEFTVNLGNGDDTLIVEYGGVTFSDGLSGGDDNFPDVARNDTTELGSNGNGDWLNLEDGAGPGGGSVDSDDGTANVLIGGSVENIVINGGEGIDDTDIETTAFQFTDFFGAAVGSPFSGMFNREHTFNGGSQDDLAEFGTSPSTFNGGPGDDEADFQDVSVPVTIDLAAGTTSPTMYVLTDVQDINGSPFDDVLLGNSLDNDINGAGGDDVIDGRAGNDGAGADDVGQDEGLEGGAGDDDITDGPGADLVDGDPGDDVVHQDAAIDPGDALDGDAGTDTIDYGARTSRTIINQVLGVCGNDANGDGDPGDPGDEFDICTSFEILITGSGNDVLIGDGSSEVFIPGAGDDTVVGGGGTNTLDVSTGGPVDTTIDLVNGTANGDGTDTFSGILNFVTDGGNDTMIPFDGAFIDPESGGFDWFSNGGTDTIDASATTIGVYADLSNLGAAASPFGGAPACTVGLIPVGGDGNCTDVEHFIGGAGDDTAFGSLRDNSLTGNGGDDLLLAGSGNDWIDGGLGNDTMDGMAGSDTVTYRLAPAGVEIDNQAIFGGGASGGYGSDTFVTGFETVLLSDFDDILRAGQTFLDANLKVLGFLGNDEITGSNSVDLLRGGKGNDLLRGGHGDDNLRGSGGDDILVGSAGNDLLAGGAGTDIGRGGGGFDVCKGIEFPKSCL